MVTVSAKSKKRAIYWDGDKVASDENGMAIDPAAEFSIGGTASAIGDNAFHGGIEEVAVWDRKLDADDVSTIFESARTNVK